MIYIIFLAYQGYQQQGYGMQNVAQQGYVGSYFDPLNAARGVQSTSPIQPTGYSPATNYPQFGGQSTTPPPQYMAGQAAQPYSTNYFQQQQQYINYAAPQTQTADNYGGVQQQQQQGYYQTTQTANNTVSQSTKPEMNVENKAVELQKEAVVEEKNEVNEVSTKVK